MLSISVVHGFPAADVPDVGTKVIVITDGHAEPRAIVTRDLKNKQHPFLTAALAPSGRSNVASVYHLLRAEPHVIQFFLGDTK